MDSYSGSSPLDFVFSYLGMTTEAQDTTNVLPDRFSDENRTEPVVGEANPSAETRPLSNFSSSSGATEESFGTYAELTLQNFGATDTNLDVPSQEGPGYS